MSAIHSARKRVVETETSPLLGSNRGIHDKKLTVVDSPTRVAVIQPPSSFQRCVGRCLHKAEWMGAYLHTGYMVLLVNSMLVCFGLLVCKATNREFFLQWSPRLAPLASWNIQIADIMLVVSYSLSNFLYLRLSLLLACLCFIIFSLTAPQGIMLDFFFWNLVMACLNVKHAVDLLYQRRHVEFTPELEQVYTAIFQEFMSRTEFRELAQGSLVRKEKAGVQLKVQGDLVTSLCVLVSGTISVYNGKGKEVNRYFPNEFLEAPEWVKCDLNPEQARFRVSFTTLNDIVFIKWPRETLVSLLSPDRLQQQRRNIQSGLRAVLGIQTAKLWLRAIEMRDREESREEQGEHKGDKKIAEAGHEGEHPKDSDSEGPARPLNPGRARLTASDGAMPAPPTGSSLSPSTASSSSMAVEDN